MLIREPGGSAELLLAQVLARCVLSCCDWAREAAVCPIFCCSSP